MFLLSSCTLTRPVCLVLCGFANQGRASSLPSFFKPWYGVGLHCLDASSHLSREELLWDVLHGGLEGTEEHAVRAEFLRRLHCSSVLWIESLALPNIEFTLLTFLYIWIIIFVKNAFCRKRPVAHHYNERGWENARKKSWDVLLLIVPVFFHDKRF